MCLALAGCSMLLMGKSMKDYLVVWKFYLSLVILVVKHIFHSHEVDTVNVFRKHME